MAEDLFTGSAGDLTTPWDYSSPSTTMGIEQDGGGNAIPDTNWTARGAFYDGSDETVSEIIINNYAGSSSGAYASPRVLCTQTQAGYEARFLEDGTNISGGSFRRNGAWIGTMSFTAQGDATGDCELAITWENEGGDSRLRAYIDGVEVSTVLDSSGSKLTTGDGSGVILYGAGSAATVGITEWRDVIGGGGSGVSGTATLTLSGLQVSASLTNQDQFTGDGALTLPGIEVAATGTFQPADINGTSVITLPMLQMAASGTFIAPISGAAALSLSGLVVDASGTVVNPGFNGSGQIVLPSLQVAATGTYTQATFTGTSVISLPSMQVAASLTFAPNIFNGASVIVLPSLQVAATLTNPDGLDETQFNNQGRRQLNARNFTLSTESYEGDYNQVSFDLGPYAGSYNERLLQFLNDQLSASHTSLPQAQLAFAQSIGVDTWDSVRVFTIS